VLEFLRGRAKHDFVDIHVKRLLDRVSDGACYRISRNLICAIEFAYRLYRAWVGAALLQFGFDVFGRFRISAPAKFAGIFGMTNKEAILLD
jgi:hypothetical protein